MLPRARRSPQRQSVGAPGAPRRVSGMQPVRRRGRPWQIRPLPRRGLCRLLQLLADGWVGLDAGCGAMPRVAIGLGLTVEDACERAVGGLALGERRRLVDADRTSGWRSSSRSPPMCTSPACSASSSDSAAAPSCAAARARSRPRRCRRRRRRASASGSPPAADARARGMLAQRGRSPGSVPAPTRRPKAAPHSTTTTARAGRAGCPPVSCTSRWRSSGESVTPAPRSISSSAAAGSSPPSWSSGSPGASNRLISPSRAPKSRTMPSTSSRLATNTSASAEASSSHCASSTRHRSGRSSAASASRLKTASETRKRSPRPPSARPSAPRRAAACGCGRLSEVPEDGADDLVQGRERELRLGFHPRC